MKALEGIKNRCEALLPVSSHIDDLVEADHLIGDTIPRLVKALELTLFYVEGDQTWEGLVVKVEKILNGEGGEGMKRRTRLKFELNVNRTLAKAVCPFGTFEVTIKKLKDGSLLLTPYLRLLDNPAKKS